MDAFQKLEQELSKLPPTANERSLYTALNNFLKEYSNKLYKVDTYSSVAEESGYSEEKHIGFPDLTLRNKEHAAGWVEVKNPGEPLDGSKHLAQFTRYKNSFENLIITNMEEWQLWQWDADGNSTLVKSIKWNPYQQMAHGTKEVSELLHRFLEGTAHEVRTPKQLAVALARKTQVLRDQVFESYQKSDDESQLAKLKNTFESTLIQNISDHQFANMVAETVAYSLFLARLEYEEKHSGQDFSIEIVRSFLPKNVPVLRDLYEIILRVAQEITPIDQAIGLLVDQLNAADIERIRHKLTDHKAGEDPVIQFYEPFLSAYDPTEREARGVYYTPKPLVDYIVRGVDHILQTRFGKRLGLADESVQILDPATGSGTFLMSAIQQVHYNIKQSYGGLGDEELERRFQQNVLQHILKHFYGFELLMAPYAVAHLKLTLELERMGFDWSLTSNDEDEDNNRLKVYLANSLDDPNQPPKFDLPGFHLAEESNKAMDVKKNAPVIAIIGNPPYSGISMNPHEVIITDDKGKKRKTHTFIGKLIEDYKYVDGVHFGEKKHWLQDDYVKFVRLSEYMISKHNEGVIGFVTNHSYLDNPTFRGMRDHLLRTFDELFVIDLHGNSVKKEMTPEGNKDENIFGIRQGVAIIFAIKTNKKLKDQKGIISATDVWGKKRFKESWLLDNSLETTAFKQIATNSKDVSFKYTDHELGLEFEKDMSLVDLFSLSTSGIQTSRDSLVVDITRPTLLRRIIDFASLNNSDEFVRNKYFGGKNNSKYLAGDTRGWKIASIRPSLQNVNIENMILPYTYRPFDNRFLAYSPSLIDWPRKAVMDNLASHNNLSITIGRQGQVTGTEPWNLVFLQRFISDLNLFYRGGGIVCPLYVYSDQMTLDGDDKRKSNLNPRIVQTIISSLGLLWVNDHDQKNENDKTRLSPLDIYDYIYAVLYSPKYRQKYKDFLKSDFPRVPYPTDKDKFWKLVELGQQLRGLHLMGDDPFGIEPAVLLNTSKWHIEPKGQRDGSLDWKVEKVEYDSVGKKVFINERQFFEGIEPEVWNFYIGGYQVMDKWLKDRKKANQNLSTEDRLHFVKIAVILRETISIQKEIDATGFMDKKQ